jgi:type I restriction enzyme R subunit
MNFEHLRASHTNLAELGAYAEKYSVTDPQSAMVKLRCFVELIVGYVYNELRIPVIPGANIHDKLISGAFTSVVDQIIIEKFHAIRKAGNKAAHEGYTNQHDAQWLVKEAYYIGCWFYMAHLGGKRQDCPTFTPAENAPRDNETKAEFKRKNKALQEKISAHDVQLQNALDELKATQEAQELTQQENAKLKLTIDQVKAEKLKSNTKQLKSTFNFNEAETRKRLIDAELRSYGWDVSLDDENTDDVSKEYKVTGQPTPTGIGYCDYVLWDDNGKPLAVIEAKRARVSAQAGREQAKLYADALEKEFNQRPVIFYTNGFDIWLWDDAQKYPPRKLYGYYAKDSLRYQITQRTLCKNLNETPIDTEVAGRLYQMETITRVSERFSDKHRKALIVQATGTGKTRVSIALTKRLLDANWAKRVLFLCDRKELRKQASNAFNEFTNEPIHVVGKSKKANAGNARVYIATYPGMIGMYEQFNVGYFDLIIADESHRSIYNKFGDPITNPKGWDVKALKYITSKLGSGSTPRGGKEAYIDKGISLIRSLNVHDNKFKHKDLAFISNEQAEKLKNVVIEKDDLLLNITGASVCRATLVDKDILPARVNQHVCIVRAKTTDVLPSYMIRLITSKSYNKFLMKMATAAGATREALTKQQIEDIEVIVPPIPLQQKFEKIVSLVNKQSEKAELQSSLPIFDSLSQKAFAGEL